MMQCAACMVQSHSNRSISLELNASWGFDLRVTGVFLKVLKTLSSEGKFYFVVIVRIPGYITKLQLPSGKQTLAFQVSFYF